MAIILKYKAYLDIKVQTNNEGISKDRQVSYILLVEQLQALYWHATPGGIGALDSLVSGFGKERYMFTNADRIFR